MSNVNSIQEEISFGELIHKFRYHTRYLLSKLLIISTITLAAAIGGYFYAKSKPTLFVADTSFSLDEEKAGGGALLGLAASFGFDVGTNGNLFNDQNIIQLFTSKKIIYSALLDSAENGKYSHADRLMHVTGMTTNQRSTFKAGTAASELNRSQDSLMNILYKTFIRDNFSATRPDKQVNIYHAVVKTPEEELSKSISKSIVKNVSDLYTQLKTAKAQQTVEILQRRVDSLRNSYTSALYKQAAILDANLNPTYRSATVGATQKQTEISTSTAAYQELLKNLEISKYSLLKQSPLFLMIDEARYPLEKEKKSGLLYALAGGFLGALVTIIVLIVKKFLTSAK